MLKVQFKSDFLYKKIDFWKSILNKFQKIGKQY